MFKKNLTHNQSQLFGLSFYLNKDKQKRLENSSGGHFYRLVFCNIQEEDFSVLYSTKHSAPNAPINCMIAALLLMQKHSWTYAQLFEQIDFNLETRFALGLQDLEKVPFTEPTLFNFKSRLNTHFVNTGEDLIGKLFDRLTNQQLKELKLKTTIQRTDSLLLNSNIRSYSRIELLVELLLRFYSILTAEEQERYTADLSDYIGKKANEYIRHIKPGDQNTHLQKLGQVYHLLYTQLQDIYREHEVFQVFSRVYAEHFTLPETDEKTSVPAPKPNEALNSKCLQSPDDTEATYRKKKGKQYQGYVAMVTETCHPDNDLQLITDVHTATNNTDDTQLLHERLDSIKEKTPDLEQLHHDGGFGSEDNDIKLNELGITPIQTAIKGCCASSPITITLQSDTNTYRVQCANSQHPQVIATKPSKNYKAEFDLHICNDCPFRDTCPTKTNRKYEKGVAIYKFKPEDYLRQQRHKNIQTIPKAHRKLRPNVEATMAQMRRGENRNGKLKVRGLINASLYSIAMAIVINFSRIVKHKKRITNSITLFSMLHALYSSIIRIAPFITHKKHYQHKVSYM